MGLRALRNPAAAVMVAPAAPHAVETYSRTARMAYSAVRYTAGQQRGAAGLRDGPGHQRAAGLHGLSEPHGAGRLAAQQEEALCRQRHLPPEHRGL
eukprot:8012939-Alexandrium_andersonii.AAC.1